ncbi:hypothetical protein GT347_09325 [Xylophilus rhododendri]|uniref:Uncharacterized protein n=1 Tax=Xylophilus rhododendri TaxID=2697032 RepID=A0A857J577_9BURK|nr:hypothetical protein [Xylophilus rhododendri]QHI98171.1 hypothetical protein GT347_09325 [Xylophilus rhododendri]
MPSTIRYAWFSPNAGSNGKCCFAGAICLPSLPLTADHVLIALALAIALAAVGLALRALRILVQSAKEGGRGLLAEWLERKRVARQRARIVRQSIVSGQAAPRYRRTTAKGESGVSS